jgi:hypothetical protein
MKTLEVVRVVVATAMVPVMLVQQGFAWGAGGHMMINQLACAALPADVPEFLRSPAAQAAMKAYGPEPDHWKDNSEPELKAVGEADHFIDMEWADLTVSPLPRKRYDFIRALAYAQKAHPDAELTPEGTGLLPYAIDEGYERLKASMRGYRMLVKNNADTKPIEAQIVFLAGILGHWVADGSQPLHATIQYNGWTGPNPNGYTAEHRIHSLFETAFVRSAVTDPAKDVAPLIPVKARVIDDVFEDDVKYIRKSQSMVEQVYKFEKAGALKDAGTAESRAFVEERLAAGATELRDIIYTAWVKSGDPLPPYRSSGQP